MLELKNVLVQYKGGGYDGCIWEWNYFLIDGRGEFVNIASSGSMGITEEEGAKKLLAENPWNDSRHTRPNYFVYDLTCDGDIEEFSIEVALPHVFGVLKWFSDNPQEGIVFFVLCSGCGRRVRSADAVCLENWHGCGGTAATADALLCSECLEETMCECCGDHANIDDVLQMYQMGDFDDDEEGKIQSEAVQALIDDGFNRVCVCCFENTVDKIRKDRQEDMRWNSFATGTPDLFGDEMRWFFGAE